MEVLKMPPPTKKQKLNTNQSQSLAFQDSDSEMSEVGSVEDTSEECNPIHVGMCVYAYLCTCICSYIRMHMYI